MAPKLKKKPAKSTKCRPIVKKKPAKSTKPPKPLSLPEPPEHKGVSDDTAATVASTTSPKSKLQAKLESLVSSPELESTVHPDGDLEDEEKARAQAFDGLSHDRKERDRLYKVFHSRMQAKAEPIPQQLADEFKEATVTSSRAHMTRLFKLWFTCDKDLKLMVLKLKWMKEDSTINEEIEGWLTEGQWADILKSPSLAHELVKRKKAAGLYRKHPDLPDREDANLYWGLKELRCLKRSVESLKMVASGKQETNEEQAAMIAKAIKASMNEERVPPGLPADREDQVENGTRNKKNEKKKTKKHGKDRVNEDAEITACDVGALWCEELLKNIRDAKEYMMRLKRIRLQSQLNATLETQCKLAEEIWEKLLALVEDKDPDEDHYVAPVHAAQKMLPEFEKNISQGAQILGLGAKRKKKGSSGKKSTKSELDEDEEL